MIKGSGAMKKLIIVVMLVVSGCATVGRQIDFNQVSKIKEGVTTQQEVVDLLGSPDRITNAGQGMATMSYTFAKTSSRAVNFVPVVGIMAGGMDTQSQFVMVMLKNGVVNRVVSSQSGMETNRNLSVGGSASMPEIEENKRHQ